VDEEQLTLEGHGGRIVHAGLTIEVDGVLSRSSSDQYMRYMVQVMPETCEDSTDDAVHDLCVAIGAMHYIADLVVDEVLWLKEGLIKSTKGRLGK